MNKTVLGVAMVVVFCITFWIVAGEAMQAVEPAKQAAQQAKQAAQQAKQAAQQAEQASEMRLILAQNSILSDIAQGEIGTQASHQADEASAVAGLAAHQAKQAVEQAEQASQQAEQAYIIAGADWRTQRSWGIGAGLLADVLLLVGALVWSKLTAKP